MNRIEIDPLDSLFSEYIRRRAVATVGGCERCLTGKTDWKQLQCSHYHGRSKRSVRWDEDNAAGLCGACHMYFGAHPIEHVAWFVVRLGRDYDFLLARMRNMERPDKQVLTLYYTAKIAELEC